jgi:predicted RNase H-like nuclease (RuvC/YqgF family)
LLQQIQNEINKKELEIIDLKNTRKEILNDPKIIPPIPERLDQNDPRCPRVCGRFDGGNRSCRHSCDNNYYQGWESQAAQNRLAMKKHYDPISRKIQAKEKEIEQLKLKSTLPYLRNELLTSITDYQELEKTDPQYRQKQIDMKKSIFEQSAKVDELETKFNWFGNIPTTQPKIITPDPIVKTTIDYEVNKRPLLILGALGLIGLFLIWRLK